MSDASHIYTADIFQVKMDISLVGSLDGMNLSFILSLGEMDISLIGSLGGIDHFVVF